MKAELNKDIRIKRLENYEAMEAIRTEISKRIQKEFAKELKAYNDENEKSYTDEKAFFKEVETILKSVDVNTKLRVVTQVGKGSTVLNAYEGHIEKKLGYGDTHFNFCCETKFDGKPFTIGFSCLQSIEIL